MSKDNNTAAGNKLIAEFMGWKHHEDKSYDEYEMNNLKYHTSWDWLMPVVEKIESIHSDFHGYFGVYICSNGCTIQATRLNTSIENPHYAYFNDVTLDTKINSTYSAVLQFIQWYNNQTTSNE